MKSLTIIFFCLMTTVAIAQPSGDIEKDTALANQYFEEGVKLQTENFQNKEISVLYKKAATLYEAHPFDKKLIEIKAYAAMQLSNEGNTTLSKTTAEEAISLMEKEASHLKEDPILLYAYNALFMMYFTRNVDKCIEYGLKMLACTKKGSKEYFTAHSSLIYAYGAYSKLEALKTSLVDLESFLKEQKDDKLDKYWLNVYTGKVLLYKKMKNYEQAILYSRKVFSDNEKYKTISTPNLCPMYMEMGIFLTRINEYDEAIEWAEKGLASTIHKGGRLGTFHSTFAYICNLQKSYKKSIEHYKKAIELYATDSITFKMRLANAYKSIAMTHNNLGEYDEAIKNIEKSKQHSFMGMQDYTLAVSFAGKGQYEIALKKLQKVLVHYSTQFNSHDIDENPSAYERFKNPRLGNNILFYKGKYEYQWGKENKDKERLLKSYETLKITFSHYEATVRANKGFDKSRFSINKELLAVLGYMIMVQKELYDLEPTSAAFNELLHLSERRKALQLIETLSPSSLPESVIKEEQALLKKLSNNGRKLDLARLSKQKDSIILHQDALFETSRTLEKYFETVKKDYPKQSNGFYNNEYASLQKIQSALSPNTLLIGYNKLKERNDFVIAIGASTQKKIVVDLSNIIANIKKLNNLIQDRFAFQTPVRNEFIDISHELYKTLIEPIESELEGKTKIMIVVEGQLFHLPFELLLKSNEKKPYHELDFLIKNYEINYHYSATAFLKLQEKTTVKDNSLLAFAPVFSKGEELNEATRSLDFLVDSLYNGIDGNEFVALPSTKKEVNKIAKIVKSNNGQTNILLSKNATKVNLSKQLESQSYQFVHIATHGLVNFKNPKLSALACYSKDETMANLFYGNEIQFQNINADLVILSSCESGIGQLVQGEGLIALNRSFIYSGAKNVLFSLWKVSDKYSSDLMIDFYENYYQTESYTSALRHAKLKLLENPTTAQPKFWAAFVLMGE